MIFKFTKKHGEDEASIMEKVSLICQLRIFKSPPTRFLINPSFFFFSSLSIKIRKNPTRSKFFDHLFISRLLQKPIRLN